jgi:hypothetical protein
MLQSMLLGDRHELETNMSLFGILQGSRTWSLDIHLELPNDLMSSELTRVKYIKHSAAVRSYTHTKYSLV